MTPISPANRCWWWADPAASAMASRRPSARAARAVHVWGTRASAADYDPAEGSDLTGLGYTSVDVGDPAAVAAAPLPFASLDVFVQCQGTVVYKRGEFEQAGWDKVMAVNLDSLMNCARRFKPQLLEAQGSLIIVSSVAGFGANVGNPAYCRIEGRGGQPLPARSAMPGRERAFG